MPKASSSVFYFFLPQLQLQEVQLPEQVPESGQPMHFLPLFFALMI